MNDEKIKVLVVEPLKKAYVKEISGLAEMQALVGGYIEAVPISDTEPVTAVLNEEGKNLGLPYNRPILGEDGITPVDIICGTFFVAGVGQENFVSLTDRQIAHYKDMYDNMFVVPVPKKEQQKNRRKGTHHER